MPSSSHEPHWHKCGGGGGLISDVPLLSCLLPSPCVPFCIIWQPVKACDVDPAPLCNQPTQQHMLTLCSRIASFCSQWRQGVKRKMKRRPQIMSHSPCPLTMLALIWGMCIFFQLPSFCSQRREGEQSKRKCTPPQIMCLQ